MRTRFAATSIVLAATVVLALAAPVAAASPWTTFKQSGTQASAFSGGCSENTDGTMTCAGTSLDVFSGSFRQTGEPAVTGDQVCYGEHSETFHPDTGQVVEIRSTAGCVLATGAVSTQRLDSVTLAPTDIQLTLMACDAVGCTESSAGSITVHGTWTGIGSTSSQKGRFSLDDGGCAQVSADRSTSRAATFEGSILADQARIGTGTFTFRTTCSVEPV